MLLDSLNKLDERHKAREVQKDLETNYPCRNKCGWKGPKAQRFSHEWLDCANRTVKCEHNCGAVIPVADMEVCLSPSSSVCICLSVSVYDFSALTFFHLGGSTTCGTPAPTASCRASAPTSAATSSWKLRSWWTTKHTLATFGETVSVGGALPVLPHSRFIMLQRHHVPAGLRDGAAARPQELAFGKPLPPAHLAVQTGVRPENGS